ncbi:MAG: hypothetical protein ACP5RS_02975 [Thermoplasmata archaeon]
MVGKAKIGDFYYCFACKTQVEITTKKCPSCNVIFDKIVKAKKCAKCGNIYREELAKCPKCGSSRFLTIEEIEKGIVVNVNEDSTTKYSSPQVVVQEPKKESIPQSPPKPSPEPKKESIPQSPPKPSPEPKKESIPQSPPKPSPEPKKESIPQSPPKPSSEPKKESIPQSPPKPSPEPKKESIQEVQSANKRLENGNSLELEDIVNKKKESLEDLVTTNLKKQLNDLEIDDETDESMEIKKISTKLNDEEFLNEMAKLAEKSMFNKDSTAVGHNIYKDIIKTIDEELIKLLDKEFQITDDKKTELKNKIGNYINDVDSNPEKILKIIKDILEIYGNEISNELIDIKKLSYNRKLEIDRLSVIIKEKNIFEKEAISIIKILDDLLEYLPDDKVKYFASLPEFKIYTHILDKIKDKDG